MSDLSRLVRVAKRGVPRDPCEPRSPVTRLGPAAPRPTTGSQQKLRHPHGQRNLAPLEVTAGPQFREPSL